jgi:hypothetical protein
MCRRNTDYRLYSEPDAGFEAVTVPPLRSLGQSKAEKEDKGILLLGAVNLS